MRPIHLLTIVTLIFSGIFGTAQQPSPPIDSVHDGFVYQGVGIIDSNQSPIYSIACFYKNGITRLVLQIKEGQNPLGAPLWRKLDTIDIPTSKNRIVVYSSIDLRLNNKRDPEIVCLATVSQSEFWKIHNAWRANRKLNRFEEIPTKGVKCPNQDYGA